jgi:dTMP kinase
MFITFEGGEGNGKSTQSKILYEKLKGSGKKCILTHEPGGTEVGELICKILKSEHSEPISAETELLLFNASRSQLIEQVILPALNDDAIVICDRYTDSTLAYQGYARGLDLETVRKANVLGSHGIVPDLTFFFDMDPKSSFSRIKTKLDRIEKESLAFHEKVRKGFKAIVKAEPKRFVTIDASRSIEEISEIIWNEVSSRIENGCNK